MVEIEGNEEDNSMAKVFDPASQRDAPSVVVGIPFLPF